MALTDSQRVVMGLCALAVGGRLPELPWPESDQAWQEVVQVAHAHQLEPFVADALLKLPERPCPVRGELLRAGRTTARIAWRLAYDTRALVDMLQEKGLRPLVLKGSTVAQFYPVPDLRKSGDIDLFVGDDEQFAQSCACFEEQGFTKVQEPSGSHHQTYLSAAGYEIEVHRHFGRGFGHATVDECLKRAEQEAWRRGPRCFEYLPGLKIPGLADAELAYSLVIHMVQHQLRGGFGLRLLLDWVAYWSVEHDPGEVESLNGYLRDSGLMTLCSVVNACCVRWLGMDAQTSRGLASLPVQSEVAEAFLEDVLRNGEFGNADKVAMIAPEKASIAGYAQTFHQQMRLNYPRASKVFVCWPALWLATLVTFVRNNAKVRHVKTSDVLRSAFRRGKAAEGLHLFERGH